MKRARRSVARRVARSPSSVAARTASTSTGGASIVNSTCVAEPSSSTTAASTSIVGRVPFDAVASWMSCGRMPTITRPVEPADGPSVGAERDPESGERDRVAVELGLDEVHRGRADERGDEEVRRLAVERLRTIDLLHGAGAHHRDARAERHRLDLVVRDVDGRDPETLVEACQLGAHVDAQLRVEVRERLVHQERSRFAHDRAAHRDALPLAAGERAGAAMEELLEPEHPRDVSDAALDLLLRGLPHLEPVGEVLGHGEVGVQSVVLEHHRDVTVTGSEPGDLAVADPDLAVADLLESGEHAKQRRLAAAGRADEHHELTARDREADLVDSHHVPREDLRHPLELDLGHASRSLRLEA